MSSSRNTKVVLTPNELLVRSGGRVTVERGGLIDFQPGALVAVGFLPIDIFSNRLVSAGEFLDTIEAGTADGNTAPALARINGATDKAARLVIVAGSVAELQFAPVPIPPDIDNGAVLKICLLVGKSANDNPAATLDVQAFFNVGDTECGAATSALAGAALAKYEVAITPADVSAYPGVLTISVVPSAHDDDDIYIYAVWVEYGRRTP